jgi:tetratricopeptide (TPR) repeat protein
MVMARTDAVTYGAERPYPGSRPFGRADSDQFFGRAAEATTLAEMWRANRLTIAWGPTASGKTSLLLAGLLPLVEGGRAEVLPPGRITYGSTFPVAALPEHNPFALALLQSWAPGVAATRLVGLNLRDYLVRRAERHDGTLLAVIDQAEDLLADVSARRSYRSHFLGELAEALADEPRLHLLLFVRETGLEFFSDTLGGGPRFRVAPLRFESAMSAVTGPAEAAGRVFGPGAAEELVHDLLTSRIGAPDGSERYVTAEEVQPALLQVVCSQLWDSLPAAPREITRHEVRRYGDADTILAAHCGRVVAAVADAYDLPTARLRSWLIRTFFTEHSTLGNAYEGVSQTAGMPNAVLRALEDRHLLHAEWRSGSRWYELLSDRLLAPLRNSAEQSVGPVEPAEYLRAAERALALGELDLAEHFAEGSLRAAPAEGLRLRAEAESLVGNLAYERGQSAKAEARYRLAARMFEAVRDTGAVARQLAAVGRTLLAQRRLGDAVVELRAAADRLPNDAVVQTALGWALWQLGQSLAAVAIFSGVLALDEANVEALRGRGEILAHLGQAREALRDLDRVRPPNRPSVRAARALALAQLGKHEEAVDEIQPALDDAPRNGLVLLYAARTEALAGGRSAAAELAAQAINATDPPLPEHLLDIARQLADRREDGSPRMAADANR